MAVLKGLIRKMRGLAGDSTFSQNQGRTIVSEKISATTNRRTSAQQRVRMRWANIIQMYKGIMPLLDCAFENKPQGVSDYNMFVKVNMQQPAEGFSVSNGFVAHDTVTGNRAFAWVHSRKSNGKTKVSSQMLVDHNATLSNYTSEGAYMAAANSYGGEKKVFLTPGAVNSMVNDTPYDGNNHEPNKHMLTLTVSPAGAGTVTGAGQYNEGANANITAMAANGYVFSKWSDNDTNATRSVTVNSDMTQQAIFTSTNPGGGNEGGGDEDGY